MQTAKMHPPDIVALAKHLSPGQYKRKCSECQGERTKHKSDRPLSLMVDSRGVKYSCHHCEVDGGWMHKHSDYLGDPFVSPPSTYAAITIDAVPESVRDTALDWLDSRGIPNAVAEAYTVAGKFHFNGSGALPAVGFPHHDASGKIVAIKWRSADEGKHFSQQEKCEDFFLLDQYEKGNDIIICEGELDALAWITAGLPEGVSVLSVPNGAPKTAKTGKVDPREDKKFAYLWRAKDALDSADKIFLNMDSDGPGRALTEEITRRIDRKKLWAVLFPDYKDAAEALFEEGSKYLMDAFEDSKPLPLLGLYTAADYANEVQELYTNGLTRGISTGMVALDRLFSVAEGMLTVVTGIPGHGKSDLVDQICMNLGMALGWKTAYCSFEKPPKLHIAQMSEKLVGKPFFDGATMRMTPSDRDWALDWIDEHFSFMDYRKGGPSTIDGILDMASAAVMRMGARVLVIDPYNYIQVDRTIGLETDFISDMLTKVQQWAKVHECHVFFVAHPKHTGGEDEKKFVPKGRNISKSAAWFAKADFGISVWRDVGGSDPSEAHIWKVKWSWLGKVGHCPLKFDPITTRWSDMDQELADYDWSF